MKVVKALSNYWPKGKAQGDGQLLLLVLALVRHGRSLGQASC